LKALSRSRQLPAIPPSSLVQRHCVPWACLEPQVCYFRSICGGGPPVQPTAAWAPESNRRLCGCGQLGGRAPGAAAPRRPGPGPAAHDWAASPGVRATQLWRGGFAQALRPSKAPAPSPALSGTSGPAPPSDGAAGSRARPATPGGPGMGAFLEHPGEGSFFNVLKLKLDFKANSVSSAEFSFTTEPMHTRAIWARRWVSTEPMYIRT
jgi:hypothetical protein